MGYPLNKKTICGTNRTTGNFDRGSDTTVSEKAKPQLEKQVLFPPESKTLLEGILIELQKEQTS